MSIRERFAHRLEGYEPDTCMGIDDEPASNYIRAVGLEALEEALSGDSMPVQEGATA